MSTLLFEIEAFIKNNKFKFNGFLLTIYFKAHGCKVGSNLRCHNFPTFRIIPIKNIEIGNNVTIGYNISFEILKTGRLIIGNNVKLTQNILITSGSKIIIGDYSLFGENVSIRDGEHNSSIDKFIALQSSTHAPVNIGKDVWIGAGCLILKGSEIPNGVIIGANSLVLGKQKLQEYTIYAGSPIKKIGVRQ